jgi:phosphoenolpyruvate-protein phosphotransferase (PTS system enzyme I)
MKEHQPKILSGKPAAAGIGVGTVWFLPEENEVVRPEKIKNQDIEKHIKQFEKARDFLTDEYEKIKHIPDDYELTEIIDAQIQTLHDPEVRSSIEEKIRIDNFSVAYAIFSTFNEYIQLLQTAGAKWANDRMIDVVSIRDEMIEATREKKKEFDVKAGQVVFATDISPTNMVKLSHIKIGGIVMKKGGLTSHAVILSQSLGIPCVINVNWDRLSLKNGNEVVIDGSTGQVILWPSWKQTEEYRKRKLDEIVRNEKALKWAQKTNRTACGFPFVLRANVEFLEELPRLQSFGATGIGLLRTETLLFEAEEFDVKEQIEFYRNVAKAAKTDSVTIRLFDAGGDKIIENNDFESNPFLGWRGVRMLLDKKALLKKQLEAIYRISGEFPGKLKILIPMVSRLEEILAVKQLCKEVQRSLGKESVPFDKSLNIGVMVEVPSIALTAGRIAKHSDFFSIGTNDLTQYTLAVDRGNEKISYLFDSFHPAIWKLIKMTKDAADRHGIPVAVCGEMASKPEAAACFIGMGITDLSMNAPAIPVVKSVLCSHTKMEMEKLAAAVLKSETLKEIHELLQPWRAI